MNYKMIKLVGVIAISALSLVGCSSTEDEVLLELQNELQVTQQVNEQLQKDIEDLEQQVKQLADENQKLVLEIEETAGQEESEETTEELTPEDETKETYILYTSDIDTYEIIEQGIISIDKELIMQEKVEQVAEALSIGLFSGLGIEVESIQQIEGKAVAVINLKEDPNNEVTWMQHYFQGSAGATITKQQLEETLLQRNNDVDWVDGIQLLYEGDDLLTDHFMLGEIIYR